MALLVISFIAGISLKREDKKKILEFNFLSGETLKLIQLLLILMCYVQTN